jgi:gamma-glutamyl hercynylcysteine S-oxide synthase
MRIVTLWLVGALLCIALGACLRRPLEPPTGASPAPYTGEMVPIPGGSFLMGNTQVGDDAAQPLPEELPQHAVRLPAYSIGRYEVTRGEYRAFMEAGGYTNDAYWSAAGWTWRVATGRTQPDYWAEKQNWGTGEFTQTDRHPVVGVSYYEAEAFCTWAGGHLPTQAQWEKAARWTGRAANVYPWGNTWDVEKCNNYMDHNPAGGYGMYRTTPVGSYPAGVSPYGCYDMAGNVQEWCQDGYASYPGSTRPFDYARMYRVLRGGSWLYNPGDGKNPGDRINSCRSACRGSSRLPYGSNYDYGFRVARERG